MILKNIQKEKIFKFENYIKIIKLLKKNNYLFARFDKKNQRKRIYLRHDIDFSPKYLQKFLKYYEKEKISSNIFFMINAKTYNLLEKKNIEFINQISKKHCCGLHIDLKEIDSKEINSLINFFKKRLKIENVISFHRPKKKDLKVNVNNKKYINAYDKCFFNKKNYVSDSAQKQNFHLKLLNLINKNEHKIQLLTHPVWWQDKISKSEIRKFLLKDQLDEINFFYHENGVFKIN